ncbi:hypothetical protein [Microlunatus soli]|uniref:hypothetical protein n=1 Tax=Microlunatus soli TaxID=630515 RepID=UPI0012F8897D|nr:hypothetical protein [Microlunatus soli]
MIWYVEPRQRIEEGQSSGAQFCLPFVDGPSLSISKSPQPPDLGLGSGQLLAQLVVGTQPFDLCVGVRQLELQFARSLADDAIEGLSSAPQDIGSTATGGSGLLFSHAFSGSSLVGITLARESVPRAGMLASGRQHTPSCAMSRYRCRCPPKRNLPWYPEFHSPCPPSRHVKVSNISCW